MGDPLAGGFGMDLQEDRGAGHKAARNKAGSPQRLLSRAALPCEKGCARRELSTPRQGGEETQAPALRDCRTTELPSKTSLRQVSSLF